MKPSGIRFPTAADAALANAEDVCDLTLDERFDRLLALLRTVASIVATRKDRARLTEERDRRKDEELAALVAVQVRGHV